MSTYPHLLPPNATALERALAGPLGRINDIPTPIDKMFRWDECPAEFLPWLAWALSVDFWDDDWPEEKQRQFIREFFELHRKKGTIYAIGRYLDFAGAKLERAIAPPDMAFCGNPMTADERMAWLERFPQVRIFDYRSAMPANWGAYLADLYLGDESDDADFFPYDQGAWEYWGRRAFLWDKGAHHLATGEETPLRWIERTMTTVTGEATAYEQVAVQSVSEWGFFPDESFLDGLYATDGDAPAHLLSVAIQSSYAYPDETLQQRFAVPGSMAPVDVWPEKVAEHGTSVLGVHMFACDREPWIDPITKQRHELRDYVGGYLPESDARFHLYDRLYYHDPARLPDSRTASSFVGDMRLGMPAYNLQLDVQITGHRPFHQFDKFVDGYLMASSNEPLDDACAAIVWAKSARDKVLINTDLHRPISTSDRVRTSDRRRTGEIIRSL